MAQAVGFSADLYAEAGLLGAYAIAANGQPLARLEAALLAQIQRLAASGPDAAEMDKVRTQLLTSALSARQTPQGLADAIGNAVLLLGEARMADETLQRLQAVSAADVQRVLKQHLLQTRRMTVAYTQAAA
jgi:zinc protease